MIEDVDRWAEKYAQLGVFSVTFHAEATDNPLLVAQKLRERGSRAGLALKPNTPVEQYAEIFSAFDQVLIMTVEPGFGGQSLIERTLDKVAQARAVIDSNGLSAWLQVDGGIDIGNIARAAQAGADTFVAGSAIFKHVDRNAQIALMRAAASGS